MKKGAKAALLIVCAVFLLVACGKKPDTVTVSEEIVVPEMSSEDLLVTSLGYLLEEENEDGSVEEEAAEQEESTELNVDASGKGEEEPEPATATVVYYGASGLKEEPLSVEEITPESLISVLAKHNIVSLDTKVLSLQEQEEDGMKVLYLDLSKAFREYLLTMSEEAECNILASIANTFLPNYDAAAMYILVEGEPLVTSHAEYTQVIYDYTPGEMSRFMMSVDEEADEEDAAEQ
ncbi:MAG: GerMN domain-containing protein [Lachnospiraceae bacterium]|nr:GerMN domain-containing protein [Lachnospiraceae bacterium]